MNILLNHFKLNSSRAVGTYHVDRGKPCEDYVLTGMHPETGVSGAVLCDGAGSCTYAKEGSEAVVTAVLPTMLRMFDQLYEMPEAHAAENLLEEARAAVRRKAGELECSVQSLCCTMLCAAIAPDGRYLYFHVGDGMIAAWDPRHGGRVLSQYRHVIAMNVTTFVTVPDTEYHFGRGKGGISAFLLTSDGPEAMLVENGRLTERGTLLIQAGCFLPEERMQSELASATRDFQQEGMYDDASFALVCDKSCAADLFLNMSPELRKTLFNVPTSTQPRVLSQLAEAFALLAEHGGVMSEKAMTHALRTHNTRRTQLKLQNLVDSGMLILKDGKYYF